MLKYLFFIHFFSIKINKFSFCLEYGFAYNLKPLVSFYSLQMQENQRLKKK